VTRGYKVSLLTALYVAQDLPYGFSTQTLLVVRAVDRERGLARLQGIWRKAVA
jgi:hypothetical protein